MERSLRVLDGVAIVIDAVAGVQAQTETVWKQASNYDLPALAFINKVNIYIVLYLMFFFNRYF